MAIRRLNVDKIEKTASPKFTDQNPVVQSTIRKKKMSLLPLLAAFR